MIEGYQLYFVLIFLYLWESLILTPRNGFLIWRGISGLWVRRYFTAPDSLYRAARGFLALGGILPPFGETFVISLPPISCSSTGVRAAPAVTLETRRDLNRKVVCLPWEEVHGVDYVDGALMVNGQPLLSGIDNFSGGYWKKRLSDLSQMSPEARNQSIEQEREKLWEFEGDQDVLALLEKIKGYGRWLRVVGTLLFFYLFILIPLTLQFVPAKDSWPALLVGALTLALLQSALYYYTARKTLPAGQQHAGRDSFLMVISPPLAIRAMDHLSRSLFSGIAPLAVAHILLDHKQLAELYFRIVRDLRYPSEVHGGERDLSFLCGEETRIKTLAILERHLNETWLKPYVHLLERKLPDRGSICPRCGAHYAISSGKCQDCRVTLLSIGN